MAFFYENLYRQDDATRLDRLGIVDEEFVGDGSSVSTSRKSVYFCMYTMHTARVWQAAYPVTTRRLPDTCIINARDDEDATLARARSPTDYLCRENETGERNIRKSGSRKGWDEEESDERNKRVGRKMKRFLPNGCRGERKERPERTRERGATSRKVVQVTDVETRGNDYFFIF